MSPERWRQVEELYREAMERSPEDRAALLADTDADLRRAVEARLAQQTPPVSPFDQTGTAPAGVVPSSISLQAGTELGVYRIDAPLGAGGMGEVYRAHDRKLGRDVAIKTLPAGVRGDPELLKRFQHEARVLAALNHPNIAAIYGLEEWAGHSFLVLELVQGETLAERLRRAGAIPAEEALTIGVQVAEALHAAHTRGITHRDIKPANIKLTPNGIVKVLDFGLAMEGHEGRVRAGGTRRLRTGGRSVQAAPGGRYAVRDAPGPRRVPRLPRPPPGHAGRLLARHLRGDQSAVQRVHRQGRIRGP